MTKIVLDTTNNIVPNLLSNTTNWLFFLYGCEVLHKRCLWWTQCTRNSDGFTYKKEKIQMIIYPCASNRNAVLKRSHWQTICCSNHTWSTFLGASYRIPTQRVSLNEEKILVDKIENSQYSTDNPLEFCICISLWLGIHTRR